MSVTARELPIQFPVRDMTGLRASEMARCPRMCALRSTHAAQAAEPTDIERRYFARGRVFGRFVAEQLEQRYGKDNVVFEQPLPWEHGVAHPDIFVRSERLFIEVKSSTNPSSLVFDMACWQVRIYMRLAERSPGGREGELHGQVYIVNPSSLAREDAIPVQLTDEHRALIDSWIEQVTIAAEGGALPDRVCRKPSDGRSRMCPFIEPCFDGWEPKPATMVTDTDILELARRHHELAEQERLSKKEVEALNGERKQVELQLAERLDPGSYEVGGFAVKRTHVGPREAFDFAKARKAGVWTGAHDEVFGPFVRLTGGHDRFVVKPSEGATDEVDYGDVPF